MPIGRARLPGVSTSLDTNGDEKAGYIRVDDGVAEGGEVSIFYDPMIAKLITWGKTRDEAADLQVAALDRFELEGLGHNIDFVSAIMQHPRFRSGELTTGFIAEEYPEGFHGAPADEAVTRALAAIAGVHGERRGRSRAARRRSTRRPARPARQVAGDDRRREPQGEARPQAYQG